MKLTKTELLTKISESLEDVACCDSCNTCTGVGRRREFGDVSCTEVTQRVES